MYALPIRYRPSCTVHEGRRFSSSLLYFEGATRRGDNASCITPYRQPSWTSSLAYRPEKWMADGDTRSHQQKRLNALLPKPPPTPAQHQASIRTTKKNAYYKEILSQRIFHPITNTNKSFLKLYKYILSTQTYWETRLKSFNVSNGRRKS